MKRGFLLLISILCLSLSYALTFSDLTAENFSLGSYNSTFYNSDSIQLSGANLSGTYTSRVFDASSAARWVNITYNSHLPYNDMLYGADVVADVWASGASGASWAKINDDYNGVEGNGVAEMSVNYSGSLFITYNQQLYKSDDFGVSWTKINDDINGAGDSNSVYAMAIDNFSNIFIIDGSEDVLKSANSGVAFTKVNSTDFNAGNGAVFGLVSSSTGVLFAADAQSDVWMSADSGVSWQLTKDDYNGAAGNGGNDLIINSSDALFIIDGQDIWQSADSGVNWVKINDDFNSGSDSSNGIVGVVDKNNTFYIADGSEDIYSSNTPSSAFTRIIENFNGANGNLGGLVSFRRYTNLTFQIRNCSLSDCSDGTWNNDNNLNINKISRYLQYKFLFSSPDANVTPKLYNVSVQYSSAPIISSIGLTTTDPAKNDVNQNLTASWTETDADNDPLFNITDWRLNGNSIALLNLPFEAGSSNSTYTKDYSSYGNNGNVSGATINATGGYLGGGYFFNADDLIVINNGFDYSQGAITFWINEKASATSNSMGIFTKLGNHLYTSDIVTAVLSTTVANSAYLSFGVYNLNNPGYAWRYDGLNFYNTGWHHVAIQANSSGNEVYIDGRKVAPTYTSGSSSSTGWLDYPAGNTNFRLGCRMGGLSCLYWLDSATLDDFRIYNQTLSSQQISVIYKNRTDLIVSQELSVGQNWSYCLTVSDRIEVSSTNCSNPLTIRSSDSFSPIFSNFEESPLNNSVYASRNYLFSANITDNTALSKVIFDFNGKNYSATNISSNFTATISELAAGTYYYLWYANDTLGNQNVSQIKHYTVARADPNLALLSSSGWDYNYGASSDFSCTSSFGTPKLFIDNAEVSNPYTVTLPASSYNIKCNLTSSQNYSYAVAQGFLNVNKIASSVSLSFDQSSPVNYGSSITPSCSLVSGAGTPILKLNNNLITSGEALTLGAGIYDFNCSLEGSQNYSSSSSFSQFIISQGNTITSFLLSPISPITYGESSNFSCSNSNLSVVLYINGADKTSENSLSITRSAGSYIVNCTPILNQNYSGVSYQETYGIQKIPGDIFLFLNSLEDNLTIEYPQQYNISAYTSYGTLTIYKDLIDISSDNGKNVTPSRNQAYYNVTAVSSGDENHSSMSITRWLNVTLDSQAPSLAIDSPQQDASYGSYSIALDYSASDVHLDSCWYSQDFQANVSLPNCQNSTLTFALDGSHSIIVYANDTLGNLASAMVNFSVLVGSPTITLNSPINIYLNTNAITFRYTVSDTDLQACELWGDFDGTFKLNQTSSSPNNGSESTFSLVLANGTYKWNVACNDSLNHYVFNGNKTFYIDTKAPVISISNPVGSKSSRTNIPISVSVADQSPVTCKYNVRYTTGVEAVQNTTIDCLSSSLNVSTDGDYIFYYYIVDYAGNANSSSSSFSVSTGTTPPVTPPGGNSGGGTITGSPIGIIDLTSPSSTVLNSGELKRISASVRNSGLGYLTNCRLKGDNTSLVTESSPKGLAAGESADFVVSITAPPAPGFYTINLLLECEESSQSASFSIEVIEKKLGLSIRKAERISSDKLRVLYNVQELSGIDQEVNIVLSLFDESQDIAGKLETLSILADSNNDFESLIDIDPNLVGNFNIIITASTSSFSTFVQESVLLGKSTISGFTILSGQGFSSILIFLIIVGFIIFSFFTVRRILKWRKMLGHSIHISHKGVKVIR